MLPVSGRRSLACNDGILPSVALHGLQKLNVRHNPFCGSAFAELFSFSLTHLPVIVHSDDPLNWKMLSRCF